MHRGFGPAGEPFFHQSATTLQARATERNVDMGILLDIRTGLPAVLVLAAALAGAVPAVAGDAVRSVPMASVSDVPDARNVSDAKVSPIEVERVRAGPDRTEVNVIVDRAKVIRLPEQTQTVVIGNPAVADIAIQKSGIVVVTGKSFGVTNVLALDNAGAQLVDAIVRVSAPTEATLTVQRGMDRQTYSCTPVCQPSIALGDSGSYFSETKGQAEQHGAGAATR